MANETALRTISDPRRRNIAAESWETQGRKYAVGAGFSEHLMRSQTTEVKRHTTSQGGPAGEAMLGRVLVVADEVDLRDALTNRLKGSQGFYSNPLSLEFLAMLGPVRIVG